jgi:uncharacterized Tic20 family protein
MKYLKWLPLVLISSICFVHLVLSPQPGKLEYLLEEQTSLVLASYLFCLLFLIVVAGTFLVFKLRKRTSDKVPALLKRPNNWTMVILLTTIFLMYFHVPARIAFAVSYPGFQQAISMPSNQQEKIIGLYKVEAVQHNPSGEVFFPTYNFWASSVTSWHGFVYNPQTQNSNKINGCGARYGAHTYTHLFGNWHIFHGTTC